MCFLDNTFPLSIPVAMVMHYLFHLHVIYRQQYEHTKQRKNKAKTRHKIIQSMKKKRFEKNSEKVTSLSRAKILGSPQFYDGVRTVCRMAPFAIFVWLRWEGGCYKKKKLPLMAAHFASGRHYRLRSLAFSLAQSLATNKLEHNAPTGDRIDTGARNGAFGTEAE